MQTKTYRLSHHREAILRELQEAGTHLSAEELYGRLRQKGSHLSFGTVYRNLRILKEQGRILELESGRQGSRFDANLAPHAHFSCVVCGHMEDVDAAPPRELMAELAQRGLEVTDSRLILYGRCRRCQDTQGAPS